jgi:hypothetical protein
MRFRDHLQYLSVDKMTTIKMDHTETVSEYVSWIHLAQDRSIAARGKEN